MQPHPALRRYYETFRLKAAPQTFLYEGQNNE